MLGWVGKVQADGPSNSVLRVNVERLAVPMSLLWIVGISLADAALGNNISLIAMLALAPFIAAMGGSPRATLVVGAAALLAALLLGLATDQAFDTQHFVRIILVALSIGLAEWIAVLRSRLAQALALAAERADFDALTGLLSRRELLARAEVLFHLRAPERPLLSVFMIDIDRFKLVNDAHGHLVGDEVLAGLARRFESALRTGDLIGRFGGDEFIGVLVGGDQAQVVQVAERLWQSVAGEPVASEVGPIPVTASVGVAVLDPGGETLDAVIRRADAALYRSKTAGRDRFSVA